MKKVLSIVCALAMVGFAVPALAGFTNGNFETGTFAGWTLGGNTGDSAIVTAGTDSNTLNNLSRVANGSYAARVGNQAGGANSASISQTVTNWQDAAVWFAWAAVLQEPTNNVNHSAAEAPDFSVRLRDLTTATDLYNQTYNVYNLPAGTFFNGATNAVAGSTGIWQFSQYFAVNLDTTGVIGHDLQLIITATDCSLGGHGGYVYLDEVGSTPPVINTPEPMTMLLLGLGLVGLAGFRKRS